MWWLCFKIFEAIVALPSQLVEELMEPMTSRDLFCFSFGIFTTFFSANLVCRYVEKRRLQKLEEVRSGLEEFYVSSSSSESDTETEDEKEKEEVRYRTRSATRLDQ